MGAMTPIKFILRSGVLVFAVDTSDTATLICTGSSETQAAWVAWSLGKAHSVEVNQDGVGLLSMTVHDNSEAIKSGTEPNASVRAHKEIEIQVSGK
jgi:hypothetical protein